MPSPRRMKKSVRKSARKVRKSPRKVRKSPRKVRKSPRKVRKSAKHSYRMEPLGGVRANMTEEEEEQHYNERLDYLRSLPKQERQRAIARMLESKRNPNPDEIRLEKRLLQQMKKDDQSG